MSEQSLSRDKSIIDSFHFIFTFQSALFRSISLLRFYFHLHFSQLFVIPYHHFKRPTPPNFFQVSALDFYQLFQLIFQPSSSPNSYFKAFISLIQCVRIFVFR